MEFYILARHAKYGEVAKDNLQIDEKGEFTEDTLEIIEENELSGCSFPAKVTISIAEDGTYALKDFWIPRDGAGLDDDIKAQFPKEFRNAALTGEGYLEQLEKELLQNAGRQLIQIGSLDMNDK